MVSIPLWFDSNSTRLPLARGDGRSFNSTLVRFKPSPKLTTLKGFTVSIPLWFDSNEAKGKRSACENTVSIPLWFDSNLVSPLRASSESPFQFHSGSIQTSQFSLLNPFLE